MDSTPGAPLLSVEDVRLHFGGLQVVGGVSFSVSRGETVALVGPNGAGKTSLLNCVSGIYRPSNGRIRYGGHDITARAPHRIARLGVARTFQLVELFRHMTVLDNIFLGRHMHMRSGVLASGLRWGRAAREETIHRRAVEDVVDFLELGPYRKRVVENLAYGVQKRIGLGRALAMEPRLLLLDEPSSGMSRQEKEDIARFLLRIRHETTIAVLWVEHDMQLVRDLADRAIVLQHGRTIAEGPPDAVLAAPHVIEAYLGARAPGLAGRGSLGEARRRG